MFSMDCTRLVKLKKMCVYFSNPFLFVKNLEEFFPNVWNKCFIPDDGYIKIIFQINFFTFTDYSVLFYFYTNMNLMFFFIAKHAFSFEVKFINFLGFVKQWHFKVRSNNNWSSLALLRHKRFITFFLYVIKKNTIIYWAHHVDNLKKSRNMEFCIVA